MGLYQGHQGDVATRPRFLRTPAGSVCQCASSMQRTSTGRIDTPS